jgi:phosphopentomutase
LAYGEQVKRGVNLGTRQSFADVCATILGVFDLEKGQTTGESFWEDIKK